MLDDELNLSKERISSKDYISFLSRTDLGSQYPKEHFEQRIDKLVKNVPISIVARNNKNKIIGVCFGLTDFSYWLFISDLGIDRKYVKKGIGKALVKKALEVAGGEKDIIMFTYANNKAIEFYEKIGMSKSDNIMIYDHIDWTTFTVDKSEE